MRKPERFKEIDGVIYKRCTNCGEFKILETEFTKAKNTTDKRTPNCKECRRKIPQDKEKKKIRYKEDGYLKKKEYSQRNKVRRNEYQRSRKNNKKFAILDRIRKLTRKARLKCKDKYPEKTFKILGCSKLDLLEYLKNKFFEVYKIEYKDIYFKDLHIDHIVPISLANTDEELIKLSHYSNLQFLHKDHNMAKKTNVDYIIPPFPIENYTME